MAKKIQLQKSIIHNVYLLYFLFIVTLLHLGYFLFTQENILLASFSLAVLFVYLVNPNMVLVLGVSLVFVDLLYLVKKMPEGFDMPHLFDSSGNRERFESFGNKIDFSGIDVSGIDVSGVDISGSRIREKFTDSEGRPLTLTNLINKVAEIQESDRVDDRGALNTLVGAKGVLKEKLTESSIDEVKKQDSNIRSLIHTVKELSPEITESMKSVNSIDINEINKLVNALNNMSKGINKNGD